MTDTERLEWWFRMNHSDAPHSLTLRGGPRGWVVWDGYDGLSKIASHPDDPRAAMDEAMTVLP